MGRGIITASRTACLRAEHEVASRGEKCARLFSVGSEIAKNRFRDPTHSLPDALPRSVRSVSLGASIHGPGYTARQRVPGVAESIFRDFRPY